MHFIPATTPPAPDSTPALFFIFKNNQLALSPEGSVPELPTNHSLQKALNRSIYLGTLDGQPCYAGELQTELEPSWEWCEFRTLYGHISEKLYSLIGHASQIVTWDRAHQFCPTCGAATHPSEQEKCKICPNCGYRSYPRISPSIIVSVTRGDELLMLRSPHFPEGLFSVVAGFVDAGETLEAAVIREVWEETGIRIKNIRYHSNQPWSFPHSLMVGFTAEYASGTLTPCPIEVEAAGWYTAETMPTLPSRSAIARNLIDDFIAATNKR